MWKQARFYSSKIGGLGVALVLAIITLVLWNRSHDEGQNLLPHFVSLMSLMLIVIASIALIGSAVITAHRIVIERRMRALRERHA